MCSLIIAALLLLCFISAWFIIAAGSAALLSLGLIFWYLPRYFKSYEILLPDGAVIINRGVFIKTSHIMPYSRLIYAQSISTPLAKCMKLSCLCLKAARSTLIIPEIEAEDADRFITVLARECEE